MATRSTISIKTGKDTFQTVYSHWDGYPSHNGAILLEHYQDEDKIKQLIAYGDVSILAENIEPDQDKPHDFDDRQDGVCLFYGRDRGEDGIKTRTHKGDVNEGEEFDYLFKDGKWYYRYNYGSPRTWSKLTREACNLE